MIPLILISKSKKETDNYLKEFIKKQQYLKTYIFNIFPVNNEILISQIREIRKEINVASTFSRLFIVHNFDQANVEAQNALLKTLEEQTDKNHFVFLVENEHQILATVRSRSKIIKLDRKTAGDMKEVSWINRLLLKVESSNDYRFLSDPDLSEISKDEAINFLHILIEIYRKKLPDQPKSALIIKKILQLKTLLESNNINPKLTCDNLLIFIKKVIKVNK